MWENGKTVETGQDKDGNWLSNFKDDDPFTVYGMEKPTFAVVDADGNAISDKYVVVSEDGVVSFTTDSVRTGLHRDHPRDCHFALGYS